MKYHACSDKLPDNDRYVLVYSRHLFGEVWHPAQWLVDRWEFHGFTEGELEDEDLAEAVSHWMDMDLDDIKNIDELPNNDRYILIFSEAYFGNSIWHPAAWLGEDDGPSGEFCWAMLGLAYRKDELKVTHWTEMPPVPHDEETTTGYDLWP